MIVVDTNILAYLYLPGEFTPQAEALLMRDAQWAAPRLWRSEFRNVLIGYLRRGMLSQAQAMVVQKEAEKLIGSNEYEVLSHSVFALCMEGGCSAYDAEFVALAQRLGVPLITADKALVKAFPATARPLN